MTRDAMLGMSLEKLVSEINHRSEEYCAIAVKRLRQGVFNFKS